MPSVFWETVDGPEFVGAICCCLAWFGISFITPSPLYLPAGNPEFYYPFHSQETVATMWLVFTAFPFTWIILVLMKFLSNKFPKKMNFFSIWSCIWAHMTSVSITNVVVIILQNYVGRASPDFYSRCGSSATPETCTFLDKSTLNEVLRSFPSQHAATSMSSLLFLTFFLQKLVKIDMTILSVLFALPTFAALWIGATRIKDYKKHASDVVAGFFIGFLTTKILFKTAKKRIFCKSKQEEQQPVSSYDNV